MSGASDQIAPRPLQGMELMVAGILLAISNFIVVLDLTIVNVSVTHIAGGLAISPTEGTYAITSYAVAEAITVPLTGWLASRFGTLRVFIISMFLFGLFSALCGAATSLGMLVAGRVMQGLAGGPIIPLSQTLLMQVYPQEKRATALGLWSVTTLLAPVSGPLFGGYICDNWGWAHIFLINIPIAFVCAPVCWNLLKRFETKLTKDKIDFVGLVLMIVWVAALQIMLDKGKDLDWFESGFIVTLGVIALVGFVAFVIWEMTERKPIVDLRVVANRGYSISVLTLCLSFGSYFGTLVLIPLWLQNYMGYTATWSGGISACMGILSICTAPLAAKLSVKRDARQLTFAGVSWLGIMTLVLSFSSTNMTFAQIALPLLIQGLGLPFFFIPLTNLALSSVDDKDMAAASGLMNFARTLSGAVATSIITTAWENQTTYFHAELANVIPSTASSHVPPAIVNALVQTQSVMLAVNRILMVAAVTFIFAALAIWFAPKPVRVADMSGVH